MQNVWGILSGKGGVGKTFISINLALSLVNKGKKVLLLDFDYNLSNISIYLGIAKKILKGSSLEDYILGKCLLRDIIITHHQIDIICGSSGSLEFLTIKDIEKKYIEIIEALYKDYDYVFIDFPSGINLEIMSLCSILEKFLLVINQEASSILDSYAVMKLLSRVYQKKIFYGIINKQRISLKIFPDKILAQTVQKFLKADFIPLGPIPYSPLSVNKFNEEIKHTGSCFLPDFDKVLGYL